MKAGLSRARRRGEGPCSIHGPFRVATALAAFALAGCAAEGSQLPAPKHAPPRAHARSGAVHGVRCAVVWDPGRGAIEDGRIVFEGEHVSSLGPASAVEAEGEELDLRPLFCMPGLVDAHTHLTSYAREQPTDGLEKRREQAARNAELTLRAGVTTVRDLGGSEGVDLWLRARIGAKAIPGPRMQCAGSQIGADGPVGGPAGARASVVAHVEAGFDVVKLFASGDYRDPRPLMTTQEIAAAADEAHARNVRVAVHAITQAAIQDAIAAHVDSIEHAAGLTADQASAMAAAGITLVPTLYVLRYYVEDADRIGLTAEQVERFRAMVDALIVPLEQRFRDLLATGVHVAMGSDAYLGLHGKNAHELSYLVRAGMTPEQAMRAATAGGAAVMGWDGKVGTVVPGAWADVLAVRGDPREDVTTLEHPVVVVAGGKVVRDDRRVGY